MLLSDEDKKLIKQLNKLDDEIRDADRRYAVALRKINGKGTKDNQKLKLQGELINIQNDCKYFIVQRNKLVEQLYAVAK